MDEKPHATRADFQPCKRLQWLTVGIIAALLILYAVSYLCLLTFPDDLLLEDDGFFRYISWTTRPDGTMVWNEQYRFGGEPLRILFWPANRMDRLIRPSLYECTAWPWRAEE